MTIILTTITFKILALNLNCLCIPNNHHNYNINKTILKLQEQKKMIITAAIGNKKIRKVILLFQNSHLKDVLVEVVTISKMICFYYKFLN